LLEKVSSATHKWDSFHIDRDRPVGSGTEPAGIPTDPSGEIDVLLGYAQDNRADALGEILSQNGEFLSYFAGLLQISPGSRSATRTLLHVSELVATAAVMHFKAQANRARPSTVCPALFPPLSVPSHPAWPSGHATQARLAFAILKFTLEGNVRDANGHMHGAVPGDHGPIIAALETLADRIAKNREIAGLHFPSDTVAGKNLGDDLLEYLKGCPAFDAVVISAKNEAW